MFFSQVLKGWVKGRGQRVQTFKQMLFPNVSNSCCCDVSEKISACNIVGLDCVWVDCAKANLPFPALKSCKVKNDSLVVQVSKMKEAGGICVSLLYTTLVTVLLSWGIKMQTHRVNCSHSKAPRVFWSHTDILYCTDARVWLQWRPVSSKSSGWCQTYGSLYKSTEPREKDQASWPSLCNSLLPLQTLSWCLYWFSAKLRLQYLLLFPSALAAEFGFAIVFTFEWTVLWLFQGVCTPHQISSTEVAVDPAVCAPQENGKRCHILLDGDVALGAQMVTDLLPACAASFWRWLTVLLAHFLMFGSVHYNSREYVGRIQLTKLTSVESPGRCLITWVACKVQEVLMSWSSTSLSVTWFIRLLSTMLIL